ncbi:MULTISPECIES: DUF1345 domain-containing protein [Ramlibacter]|uniref:DUF1345 domain-containing protein n=1 Tax=Ramlibacter aquaticus TaxID=2780094 RepID=A0ABR9SB65_9BURK|nr:MULTISPECIES: DUF1345 domain-containing protein [Ramlibacter]MBE7939581.1 DUF1345 domain-containing protein [Ramlibacter aquaticus]
MSRSSTRSPHAHSLAPTAWVRGLRQRPRLAGSVLLGAVLFAGLAQGMQVAVATAALLAWNASALVYLGLAWHLFRRSDARGIRERALAQDEGRVAILVLVVVSALAVLLAVGSQLAQAKDMHGGRRELHLALAALTVLTSWLFTQVLFALHYAHDFYSARVRGELDPLAFPSTPDPDYADFLYFSCVIGAAAQTADVSFNGPALRPVGTLHCILAFFFNATLLALSINLAAGLLM